VFVKDSMTANVKTLSPSTTAADALATQFDILVALSHEFSLDYLQNTSVEQLMTRDVETINENDIIEEAAYIMYEGDYSLLPVVGDDGEFIGIISERNVYDMFVELLGLREPGTRITLLVEDRVGMLADIAAVIKRNGISIASLATRISEQGQMADVVVRLKTIGAHGVVQDLRESGFRVMHVSQVWR